jgi:hypothetical protein
MIAAIVILSLLLIASVFSNIILLKKLEASESSIDEYEKHTAELYLWIVEFKKRVGDSYSRIKQLDTIGQYSGDDEVGFFFKELLEVSSQLNYLIQEKETKEDE